MKRKTEQTKNSDYQLSKERIENITKGMVEIQTMVGNLVLREKFPIVENVEDLKPDEIKSMINQLSQIQEWIDRQSVYFSYYITHQQLRDWSKGGTMFKHGKKIMGKDFDIKRWVIDYDYYMDVFNNHRQIHSMIGGFSEYMRKKWKPELQDCLNKTLNGIEIDKFPPLMDECMDYWGELYDSQSDEDVERYYNTLLKKWNQSFTTYKRTPFEKSLHKFNSENSINKKHTTISNHKEVN